MGMVKSVVQMGWQERMHVRRGFMYRPMTNSYFHTPLGPFTHVQYIQGLQFVIIC